MAEQRRYRRIDVDLDGIVTFSRTNSTVICAIHDISREGRGVKIVTSDPRICAKEDVNLAILIPTDSSPVKCAGRITWYSEDEDPFRVGKAYVAGVLITDMSTIDQKRLEFAIDRSKV